MKFRGTKGIWIADIRTGCCAVYPESRKSDTNGLSRNDDRNIFYSNKDSFFNGEYWEMSEEEKYVSPGLPMKMCFMDAANATA